MTIGPQEITDAPSPSTRRLDPDHTSDGTLSVRGFTVAVVDGPCKGQTWRSNQARCSIGSHPSNDLVIHDEAVSRFHCEIRVDKDGARLRDLDSLNGTTVEGTRVVESYLNGGALLRIGTTVIRFGFSSERMLLTLSERTSFGGLVGTSAGMRASFAALERAAISDATILLEGETGTGKEEAARAIHEASPRRNHPFVVVDCTAIPESLFESELFGHERGSFTGAAQQRIGAFEEASSGTIFLDEIGELPLELQPKLLRALERREVRRIGGNQYRHIDVRVVAATNRDLRAEVNTARFRSDLYYRLAVVKVVLPPLRTRPEDVPHIAETIIRSFAAPRDAEETLLSPSFMRSLQRMPWPGNVRELRNYLERCLVFHEALPCEFTEPDGDASAELAPGPVDGFVPYDEARRRALAAFERSYVGSLLELHGGNLSQAARAAGINRVYLYRLTRRHSVK